MTAPDKLPTPLLVAFATIGYLALLVAGLGVASAVVDDDIISTPGVSLVAAYLAAGVAIAAFALLLAGPVSRERPSYWAAASTALGSAGIYTIALAIAAFVSSGDLSTTGSVLREVLLGWVVPVVLGSALVAAWAGIALRRTAARPPRWPWEDDE
ncbi:hypothetical protein GCM10010910_27950 [Microbacterium nanhaiense]|uniref:Uncharacterized protein n=1 Tax=Microbacterium nanhaiense TaxID=1301026 RepID=A0ABQ2N3F3_9MICO|nr:hypothetical protein [Microbacterium nanhaiense]GGO67049.1 hypothetical protein GCM10010910_27950 [Microbacterium nanhaiense]